MPPPPAQAASHNAIAACCDCTGCYRFTRLWQQLGALFPLWCAISFLAFASLFVLCVRTLRIMNSLAKPLPSRLKMIRNIIGMNAAAQFLTALYFVDPQVQAWLFALWPPGLRYYLPLTLIRLAQWTWGITVLLLVLLWRDVVRTSSSMRRLVPSRWARRTRWAIVVGFIVGAAPIGLVEASEARQGLQTFRLVSIVVLTITLVSILSVGFHYAIILIRLISSSRWHMRSKRLRRFRSLRNVLLGMLTAGVFFVAAMIWAATGVRSGGSYFAHQLLVTAIQFFYASLLYRTTRVATLQARARSVVIAEAKAARASAGLAAASAGEVKIPSSEQRLLSNEHLSRSSSRKLGSRAGSHISILLSSSSSEEEDGAEMAYTPPTFRPSSLPLSSKKHSALRGDLRAASISAPMTDFRRSFHLSHASVGLTGRATMDDMPPLLPLTGDEVAVGDEAEEEEQGEADCAAKELEVVEDAAVEHEAAEDATLEDAALEDAVLDAALEDAPVEDDGSVEDAVAVGDATPPPLDGSEPVVIL